MKHKSFSLIFLLPSLLFAQEINLGEITTYIERPVVEQRQFFSHQQINEMNVSDLPSLMVAAGIQILSYGPYGLEQKPSIRGFTDETVRVVIDGICVNNAQYGTFDFSSINIDDIESIEIVRGGFTEGVSDEGAVGGAIYITTKRQGLGHHFYADTSIKTYFNYYLPIDSLSQSVGYNGQIGDSFFVKATGKVTFAANRYLFNNYQNKIKLRENAEVADGNGLVNFQHYYGKGNLISVNEMFYGGNKNTPGSASSKSYGNQKDYDNNLTVQHTMPMLGDKPVRLNNSFSWLSNTRFYTDSISDSKHYVNTFKYAGTVDFFSLGNFKQSAGLTLDYTHLNSTDDGVHGQFAGTLKSTTKYSNGMFSFSVPLTIKCCNENIEFIPKLGVGLKSQYIDVLLDGYRMIQFPNMDDLYWDGAGFHGNPELKPESGWGGDFTVNAHNIFLPVSLCIFTNYYENKIQWAGNTPQNVASAFYLGVDFNFEKAFWNNQIFIRGNGEYLYTRLLDKSNITYGKKIMWTPDFVGSLSAGIKLPLGKSANVLSLMIDGNYVGERYISNLNITSLDPYFLINLSGEIVIKTGKTILTPYMRIDNLFDTKYESVTDYPMPGISGTLGIKINL